MAKPDYTPLPGESPWDARTRVDSIRAQDNIRNIASVITHPQSHSVRTHADEFGGREQMRQAILDSLNDPHALVKKSSVKVSSGKVVDKYYIYSQKHGVYICIDPSATDWGTAHTITPEDARRKFNAISSNPAQALSASILSKMDLDYFQNHTRLNPIQPNNPAQPPNHPGRPEGGRIGRAAAAVGVALVAISATQEANAASSTQQAVIAAGREVLMGMIPFTGAAEALSQGRRAEALVSFIGDCSFLGMGASEMLRPILRAAGSNVEPGMIESALSGVRQPNPVSPQKLTMMDMVRDIPSLSPEEISSRRIPFGPVAQVSVQKYRISQEMEKIKTLLNGRDLEDLSPAEQDQYGRMLGRVQMSAREIKRVWEKEVDHKLGPSCNYGGTDPVQGLKNQIKENLNRGSRQSKSFSPDDIHPRTRGISQPFKEAHDQGTYQNEEPDLECNQPQNNQDLEPEDNLDRTPRTEPQIGRYDILRERGALSQIFLDMHNKPKDAPIVKSFPAEEVYIKRSPDLSSTLSP